MYMDYGFKELRSELQKRGLEKNGVKATLVARLSKALELENANQPYIANIKDVSAEASNSSEVNMLNKTGNGNESTGCQILLKQILNAITGFDERLKSLENKFSDQISIITEHIDTQNVNYRHVEEERRNLQKISELLSNNNVENSNGASSKPESNTPQPSKERYVANIPMSNRFDAIGTAEKQPSPTSALSMDDQLEEYRERRRADHDEARQDTLCDVIVAGDSMLRNIMGKRLSRVRKVTCQPNPGAKVEHLSPARICNLVKRGGEVIVHAGTNNSMEGPKSVHDKLISLGERVRGAGRQVSISNVIHRRWETPFERKWVDAINHHLQTTARERGWGYIDNSNIDERHLGVDGVHLTKSGQAAFAGNLARYINRHRWSNVQAVRSTQQPTYAEAASGRSVTPRVQQDFNQDLSRARLKSPHHQPMEDPEQWQNYLRLVREVTGNN